MQTPTREQLIGARVARIGHSKYSDPKFVIQGIGPASFRSHFIVLDSGIVVDLFTAELTLGKESAIEMTGETIGIPVDSLVGRVITDVWRDNVFSSILILDHSIYLKDANDGAYGNPLYAGSIKDDFTAEEIAEFLDYWTEKPIRWNAN